jgi:flagellar motor protein MotB
MSKRTHWLLVLASLIAPVARAQEVTEAEPGQAVERHLPSDEPLMQWAQDPGVLATESGDRLEKREVVAEGVKTVKLKSVVPAIRFASGVADIPASYVERLRSVLDGMQHLKNVRLHLVGHADDQPLSDALAGVYGDNAGLSRERAGEVATFLQRELSLPPESISFEWAGDGQPIATNATPEGRALNRRVEVEVWYDEAEDALAVEEVVVPHEIKRLKVCRTETVCKLRYREGHARRARVKNLVPPLHWSDESVGVSEQFVGQVAEALHNLGDKQNVAVKLIGFTDDAPLTGPAERIYGTHLALSKARAHRVALALQEALHLPSAAVTSDGRGTTQPLASNETERGRALNRRIEVELWHDDPLQELPEEPQPCPDAGDAELVTRVYDPAWGRIAPLPIEGGEPVIPPGYADDLRRALADVADKTHPRLRFVGYTANEALDRRTALVYGDDIGLSAARARRAMEAVREQLGLSEAQAEHEGRGYVHSDDVVNAGFIQGETSYVVVQVVYDELALPDDYEGIDITPITRELRPQNPLGLNLMRITVDGEPIDDPGRSSADVQRCTDVALERADIQFQFDDLKSARRLSVTAQPTSVPVGTWEEPGTARFRMYSNYSHFIERSEVRIFEKGQSLQADPLGVAPVGPADIAVWQTPADPFPAPVRELKYLLRAYGKDGAFDETEPRPLWLVHGDAAEGPALVAGGAAETATTDPTGAEPKAETKPKRDGLLAGYGESDLAIQNIALGNVGSVRVRGRQIPPEHTVWLAGDPVPVDEDGNFIAEAILPAGLHTVEVAVLDPAGNGELFLRDLEFGKSDWFYVGMADLTLSANDTNGPVDELTGDEAPDDLDSAADGRLAFFADGKWGEDWGLRASADTREGPVEQLFTNFVDKSPEALLRRIDPDYYYPTFGDDGVVEETAPTLGKFFVKLNKRESHALWGNFKVGYLDNELAHVDRGLYGGNLHFQSDGKTRFGEQRLVLDGFGAEPGTVPSREEFRGTGGSLYFLRNRDLLAGSERVRIEVRDRDSGLVSSVVHLRPVLDYDIDYLQGRVLLAEPLSATADDNLLVRTGGLPGAEAWLVVQYEYTPGLDAIDALATGGQGGYWFNDFVKLGLTANQNDDGVGDSSLYGTDLTFRKSTDTWLKLQAGKSEGLVSNSLFSEDGGFGFFGTPGLGLEEADSNAYRADVSVSFADFLEGGRGRLNLYAQDLGAGYSAPGMNALTDTEQFGGLFRMPVTDKLSLAAKADHRAQTQGLETTAGELDGAYRLTDRWSLSGGVRNDRRKDDSPISLITQEEGERTDAVIQLGYDSLEKWRSYGFVQETLARSGDREDNGRIGVGGAYRFNDQLRVDGEVSHGDLGPGAKLGTTYQASDRTQLYLNYALENERTDNGMHARGGNLITGAKTRLSDSTSVHAERRQQQTDTLTGLTHATGITLAPTDRWNLGANADVGTLFNRQTGAEIRRRAGGARIGYGFDTVQLSSGLEYRFDETEQLDGSWSDRTTWLFRNTLKYQTTPDWRVIGKLNYSDSDSSLGDYYDGGYTEAVLGYAFRPVKHDRFNAFAKYTYFYNIPATDLFTIESGSTQFLQQSHIASLDLTYDLTASWSIGGKYAYRLGEVSLEREDPEFFDNNAHLYIARADWRFLKDWESSLELRLLDLPDLEDRRSGAVFSIYRYLGDHFKVGVGYNFTDFSDDLTDMSYDHRGVFLNIVGTM